MAEEEEGKGEDARTRVENLGTRGAAVRINLLLPRRRPGGFWAATEGGDDKDDARNNDVMDAGAPSRDTYGVDVPR